MKRLFEPMNVGKIQLRNRVVVPPMVCFGYSNEAGLVTEENLEHYGALAQGGPGLIIIEATCVLPSGRLSLNQLGLWEDRQIAGMKELVDVCHKYGAKVLVQLHHAGRARHKTLNDPPFDLNTLELSEIKHIQEAFISAAKRAEKAGFDGVELHGAHGYLMSQWASAEVNHREDEYGGSLVKRMNFAREIIAGIQESCKNLSLLAYRMGGNEPTLEDGKSIAQALEKMGVDLLHVSAGVGGAELPEVPEGFPRNGIVYMGAVIKKAVSVPVIAVNSIRKPEEAELLIEKGYADFIALGRPHLVDANWSNKVISGVEPISCLNCKPCKWFKNGKECPRRLER